MAKKVVKADKKGTGADLSAEAQRKKALETAIAQIKKENGEGSIIRLGDAPTIKISAVSTGSLTLD